MRDDRSFSSMAVHVHDETPVEAKVNQAETRGGRWGTLQVGGIGCGVNLTINVWDRDTLRRLADAAALAYHQWTKAETEEAWEREVNGGPPVDPTGIDCVEVHEGVQP